MLLLFILIASMQFRWVPTTYAFYEEVDKKYNGCYLKTTELLDCALITVCAVIKSKTVYIRYQYRRPFPVSNILSQLNK